MLNTYCALDLVWSIVFTIIHLLACPILSFLNSLIIPQFLQWKFSASKSVAFAFCSSTATLETLIFMKGEEELGTLILLLVHQLELLFCYWLRLYLAYSCTKGRKTIMIKVSFGSSWKFMSDPLDISAGLTCLIFSNFLRTTSAFSASTKASFFLEWCSSRGCTLLHIIWYWRCYKNAWEENWLWGIWSRLLWETQRWKGNCSQSSDQQFLSGKARIY